MEANDPRGQTVVPVSEPGPERPATKSQERD